MYHSSEFGCRYHGHQGHHSPSGTGYHHRGCCCDSSHGIRRFLTREEILAELEEYLKQLKAEVKGVEERIAEFKKTS
ncbi:hypothetical protein ACFLV5_04500 [Chloroflexota bacterium]